MIMGKLKVELMCQYKFSIYTAGSTSVCGTHRNIIDTNVEY